MFRPGGESVLAAGPNPDQDLCASSARRARDYRLTIHRRARRRRTRRNTLACAGHLDEWCATGQRRTHWNRSADRQPAHRRTHRDRGTHGHRRADRNRRSDGDRSRDRNRPWQGHRNTGHLGKRRAGRARGRRGTRSGGFARRRLQACVIFAAGYQRGGRHVRAQRHRGTAQSSASSKYCDGDSIKDRHRHRTLRSRSAIRH
jgi:hypothetical protein